MKILHIIYKSGANSITLLVTSFKNSPTFFAEVFDCEAGNKKWFWKLIKQSKKYNIAHFHNSITFLAIPFIRIFHSSTKIIITVHDIGFQYRLQTSGFLKAILLEFVSVIGHLFAHQIIFVSKSAKDRNWLDKLNFSSTIISNGLGEVLAENKKLSTKPIELFFIGNHFYVKGLDRLIKYKKSPLVPIHLFGFITKGGGKYDIENYESWKIGANVIEHGHVSNNNITDFMNVNNPVFMLFSTSEASPISVIECMQKGIPIIATNLPFINEYKLENLVQIVDDTPTSLLNKIELVRNNYQVISTDMKALFAKNFTSERYLSDHLKLYTKLLLPVR